MSGSYTGPLDAVCGYSYSYSGVTYNYNYTSTYGAPVVRGAAGKTFEDKPNYCNDGATPQSHSKGVLTVAMMDGSVRGIRSSVSAANMLAAFTPASGDIINGDL